MNAASSRRAPLDRRLQRRAATPVTTTEVVLGKYAAAYLLYVTLWGSTGGFFYVLKRFSGDARFVDPGPLIGGYVFVAVSGLLFVAVGLGAVLAAYGVLLFATSFAGALALSDLLARHLREPEPEEVLEGAVLRETHGGRGPTRDHLEVHDRRLHRFHEVREPGAGRERPRARRSGSSSG